MFKTHKSHAPKYRQAGANFESEVKQRGEHDDQVEDVPSVGEKLLTQRHNFHDALQCEDCREHLPR